MQEETIDWQYIVSCGDQVIMELFNTINDGGDQSPLIAEWISCSQGKAWKLTVNAATQKSSWVWQTENIVFSKWIQDMPSNNVIAGLFLFAVSANTNDQRNGALWPQEHTFYLVQPSFIKAQISCVSTMDNVPFLDEGWLRGVVCDFDWLNSADNDLPLHYVNLKILIERLCSCSHISTSSTHVKLWTSLYIENDNQGPLKIPKG